MKKKQTHPANYWNDIERCRAVAERFSRFSDFERSEPSAYSAAQRNGWFDEITAHMSGRRKYPPHYFDTFEHCFEVAQKYTTLEELRINDKGCHQALYYKHPEWREKCFAHFDIRTELSDIELRDIVEKYTNYTEFKKKEPRAFSAIKYRGLIDDLCGHMNRKVNVPYDASFTFEECAKRAKKYNRRTEFDHGEDKRYAQCARKRGWFKEITSHMVRTGNRKKRCIYVATFSDNYAYVGLTYFAKKRWNAHLKDEESIIYSHVEATGLTPEFIQLTEYIPQEEASKLEGTYLSLYEDMGYTMLNRAPTGALGSSEGYSKEDVINKAKEAGSLKNFREKYSGYYQHGYRSDYWDEILEILPREDVPRRLSIEVLKEIASQCHTMQEFRKKDPAALDKAKKIGILDEICSHFDRSNEKHFKRMPRSEKIKILDSGIPYSELSTKYPAIYCWLRRNKDYLNKYYPEHT
ncbi:MAG: GIY-YIG nuclease family protein [Bacteroidales bacterium]|nr:GIY-YIG nuclease family protein [Candidatus Liminaster caballi]